MRTVLSMLVVVGTLAATEALRKRVWDNVDRPD